MEQSAALTLAAFQQHIRDRYYPTDKARGTPGTFMWFIEEVGELSTSLHKAAGEGGDTSGNPQLDEEFADVLAWLCTLANINDIDLTEAVKKKYLRGPGPQGHK
jgi:NTP pyrophosphatase (non-canonical NTP hydrolase)